jgi:thiol:disulfide interchange protein
MSSIMDRSSNPYWPVQVGVVLVAAYLVMGGGWTRLVGTKFEATGEDPRWDRAVEVSQATKQPGLVLVTADWCGGCQWLHNNVLNQPKVRAEMAHYTFFKVDMTKPTPAAVAILRKLGVDSYPTVIRYNQDGREAGRKQITSAENMADWLHGGY